MSKFYKLGHRFLGGGKEYILAAAGNFSDSGKSIGIRLSMVCLETGKTIGTTHADKNHAGDIGLYLEHLKDRYRTFHLLDKETMHPVGEIVLNNNSTLLNGDDECWLVSVFEHDLSCERYRILSVSKRIIYASGSWKYHPTLSEVQEVFPGMRLKE